MAYIVGFVFLIQFMAVASVQFSPLSFFVGPALVGVLMAVLMATADRQLNREYWIGTIIGLPIIPLWILGQPSGGGLFVSISNAHIALVVGIALLGAWLLTSLVGVFILGLIKPSRA